MHEVSYICKCMQTQDSNFTGSLCRQSDELRNLQGEIYFTFLRYPKATSASCFSLLWEASTSKSQPHFIWELRQERIAVLHGTDRSTLFCPLSMYDSWHGIRGIFLWPLSRRARDGWSLGHIRGARTNLPTKGGMRCVGVPSSHTI